MTTAAAIVRKLALGVAAAHARNVTHRDLMEIAMEVSAESLTCERQAEYGYDTVNIELPAVISVGDAINEPRYPSLKAIMGAKKKPLESVTAGDVSIDTSLVEPSGRTVRSCTTRRSFGCRPSGMSPISSKKPVPPCASTSRPECA